jgi:hypothetical protein
MSDHTNQERIWIAASLHRRIKAVKKRTGKPMLQVANELIRDGLKVESGMREVKRIVKRDKAARKARRDGRGSER